MGSRSRDLVLAVAKGLFQEGNPERQRLPKGFEAGFRLVLERVDSGSAVPFVSRVFDDPGMNLLFPTAATPDLFDRARDVVERGIAAAANGKPLPKELTKEILARFNAFGRTLAEDESIVVAQPGKRDGAIYDRAVRRKLVLQAQATYEDDVNLLGEVRAADKDAEGCPSHLGRSQAGGAHPSAVLPVGVALACEAALVRVRGTGLYDADSTLLKVTMATDVKPRRGRRRADKTWLSHAG